MSFDFATLSAPHRMQPGLRRVAPGASQLSPNRLGARHLDAKIAVLRRHAEQALLTAPGFDPRPVQAALMRQAVADWPSAFDWDGGGLFSARLLGWSLQGERLQRDGGPAEIGAVLEALAPAQRLTGLLSLAFEEDFAAIDGAEGRINWLAVCLPSQWSPAEKIGLDFRQVHGPVADHRLLMSASAQLVKLVTGDERWQREVWTVTSRPGLDAHPLRSPVAAWPADASAEQLGRLAYFRSEQQSFIPVPVESAGGSPQAAFAIRVEVDRLTSVIDRPERVQRLHDALASMTPAVLAYRGLGDARDRLLAWLAARAV